MTFNAANLSDRVWIDNGHGHCIGRMATSLDPAPKTGQSEIGPLSADPFSFFAMVRHSQFLIA